MIDKDNYATRYFNQMFTVPEHAETHIFDYLQHSIMTEEHFLQQDIFNILGIRADKPKSIPNPADTTKSIRADKPISIPNPADTTKSTPAHADENDNIYKDGNYVRGSTVHNDEYNRIYKATNTETLKLTKLGKARRDLTGDAIINVLTKKLGDYK
ncbi:uncharacterized protein LOC126839858 [Adelges cooleyi]|uniref:uncharacterized protein LOC126839858 n=1 Tax=Adelges cooleyi TaxID=133065 RepID=UPI0021803329|nr:uncharacterized protein LOC126839858 [Adelges cooleyi]